MNTLAGIDLRDLAWDACPTWVGVEAVVERSLAGAPIRYERAVSGRPVDLVGDAESAWFTGDELSRLRWLASQVGATYDLVYDDVLYRVRFRHEDGPLEAQPVRPGPGQADDDRWHSVVLRLAEVSA